MAIVAGHIDAAEAELAEAATYTVSGHNSLAGSFRGRRAIAQHLEEFQASLSSAIDPIKWVDWLVGVDHTGVLVQWHLQRERRLFEGTVLFLAAFEPGGEIASIDVFFRDSPRFDDFLPS